MDKPEGPTSHDVVDEVRRAYTVRRVGHAGTLDPLASGLLVILLGRATRLARFVRDLDKRYEGTIRLGETTETDDRTGAVTRSDPSWESLADARITEAAAAMTGRLIQRPPAYSAKKSDGERAYRRARRGEAPALTPVEVEVAAFDMVARDGADVRFRAAVGSGTYIRALARDLGEALGCGAHLAALRRTSVGPFDVQEAHQLSALDGPPALLPMRTAVDHLPAIALDDTQRGLVGHGRPLPAPPEASGPTALLWNDVLVAVAEQEQGMLKPRVVVAPDA